MPSERKPTKRTRRPPAVQQAPVTQRRHFFFGSPTELNLRQAIEAVGTTGDRPVALLVAETLVKAARELTGEGGSFVGVFEHGVIGADLPVGNYAIEAEQRDGN